MKHLQWDRLIMPVAGVVLGLFLIARPWIATAALCSLVGGYVGAGLALKNGTKIIRPMFFVVLALLLIRLVYDLAVG